MFLNSGMMLKSHTQGRADAQYMGFESKAEAELAFQSTYTKALTKRSIKVKMAVLNLQLLPPMLDLIMLEPEVLHHQQNKLLTLISIATGPVPPNPGKSGTGMAVYQQQQLIELWYGLYEPMGTNNTAELNGMLAAFKYAQALCQTR
ncbi:hypothetical protein [Colwellia sp. M166]|uniref:hypothetical protein n=1 Tax=Colwellia sp. M166 TaxID=2583805 RepID=UPI00211DDB91|nr:hypothetical protein [Colwellia sp. M166]